MSRFIFLLLLLHSKSQKLLSYRPGVNFGQILLDYSGNNLHAVSGSTTASESTDVFPTDRGCYIDGPKSQKLTLPANDISTSSFSLPSTFMIALWLLVDGRQDGLIYARYKDSNNYFYLRRYDNEIAAAIKIVQNGKTVGEGNLQKSSFVKGKL